MKYVFDTNTLTAIFRHYYYDRFPSFWAKFNLMIQTGEIVSVREVRREIEELKRGDRLEAWVSSHPEFFQDPTIDELKFITTIYSVRHFQQNLEMKKLLHGGAFADPFIISKAKINQTTVVTQEQLQKNGVKIPNICQHFNIICIDLEGFLTKEDWTF